MKVLNELSALNRLPEEGILFGVCAGLADYYGWRVRTLRFVMVLLAFLVSWPVILAYVIGIFLLPTADEREEKPRGRAHARSQASRRQPGPTPDKPEYSGALRQRYASIEGRMRRVEAYLHGHEYQLRSAFKDLEN